MVQDRAWKEFFNLFFRNTVQMQIYMSTHPMNIYTYTIPLSISERLSRFGLEIHEVSHQEQFTVDENITSH
jgi:hypothetical protein